MRITAEDIVALKGYGAFAVWGRYVAPPAQVGTLTSDVPDPFSVPDLATLLSRLVNAPGYHSANDWCLTAAQAAAWYDIETKLPAIAARLAAGWSPPAPVLPSAAEQLERLMAASLARLLEISADPKPTYTIRGQTIKWAEYAAELRRTAVWCQEQLRDLEGPFEVVSQAFT